MRSPTTPGMARDERDGTTPGRRALVAVATSLVVAAGVSAPLALRVADRDGTPDPVTTTEPTNTPESSTTTTSTTVPVVVLGETTIEDGD